MKLQFLLTIALFFFSFSVGLILKNFISYWPKLMQKKWCKLYDEFLQVNQLMQSDTHSIEKRDIFHFSKKFFLVEFITVIITLLIIGRFGFTWVGGAIVILAWGLIVLSNIDAAHQLLPDAIVLPLLWLGLWVNGFGFFVSPSMAIRGAVFGYVSLWILSKIYRLIRRVEGMGGGDFKLLAMWGAWLGVYPIPMIVLVASILASIVGGIKICFRGQRWNSSMAFGPYLAFSGMIILYSRYPVPFNWE